MKKLFVIFLLTVLIAGLIGPGIVWAAGEQREFGGTLTIGIIRDPDNLNPLISNDRIGSWILNNIYPTLLIMNQKAEKVPYLAEQIITSADGKKVTVKLKKGLQWQDGTPLTAADVKYTGDVLYQQKLQWQADTFNEVERVETPDDYTVVYYLKQPYPGFIGTFGFWQRIVPKHIFEKIDNIREFTNDQPMGLGPFQLVDFKRGQYYTLKSVDQWFDAPAGRPYLDKIIFRVYPDVNTMVLALKRGEIDLTAKDIPHTTAQELKNDPKFTVVQTPSLGFVYLGFNYQNEFLKDRAVRQAIATAIDRKKILMIALRGDGMLIDTGVSPVYENDVNPAAKLPAYSPEKAVNILKKAGYQDIDGNGIVNAANGKDLIVELIYDGNDIYLKKTAQILATNFQDIGIKLNLKPLEKSTYSDLLFNQKKFDLNLGGWGIIDEASDSMFTLYHSTSFLNFMGLKSTRLDQLIETARFAAGREVLLDSLYQFQEEFVRELPVVTLYVQQYNFAYSNQFAGFKVYPSDLKGLVDPQSTCRAYQK